MSQTPHPTSRTLELAAVHALDVADQILSTSFTSDPVRSVGSLLMSLHVYCLARAGGTGEVWADALAELRRLELELEASTE
ncbi:hypothetical protein [Singulisphaera sp. PoT]|uniref:hypothetical protein n=1 Tax=Singulisphaera sp. PoT TaxID=3411797 RepID=UPI003BF545F7